MVYENIKKAIFHNRPNRFVARCFLEGKEVIVHVKNTGRCKELLIPGATVYLEVSQNPKRKTPYSLIAVEKGDILVNTDSTAPNKVVFEALTMGTIVLPGLQNISLIKQEAFYNNSRFDFYVETKHNKAFIEVKGVTLEENGVAMFPDAPTERGVKHLEELIEARGKGYLSYVLFIIQMKGIKYFMPNYATHPLFGETLSRAKEKGVQVCAYDCHVTPNSLDISSPVQVKI